MSYVNLSHSPIGDGDLSNLEGLLDVDCLDLSGTKVTDLGLKCLKVLPRLQVLTLDDTCVTDAGIEDFHRDCPHITILR
jgi:hypothetical protein